MLIGYRDYVKDGTLSSATSFSAGAPLSNVQTRNLAVVAVSDSVFGAIDVTFGASVDVGIAAILNHNIGAGAYIDVELYDAIDNLIVTSGPSWLPPSDSQFSRNAYFIFDLNIGCNKVRFRGHGIGGAEVRIGRLWAGPAWRTSEDSVSREDFDPRIVDPGTINKSLGGQNYADVRQKYRQHTMRLPWLSEAEAIGIESSSTMNLQDISFEVGKTDPIIAIPSLDNNQVIHKLGMYGTFAEPPSPRLIPSSAERHYESTFDVIEEL